MLRSPIIVRLRAFSLIAGLVCTAVATPTTAQSNDPNQLRAAIVFNVLRFVEFPADKGSTLDFCVASDSGESSAFRSFSGRRVGSRTVSVRTLRGSSYSGCDVVFLDTSDRDQIQRATARGRLVIGNGRNFIDNGGTVGLVQSGGQVRFQLNLGAAADSQITISSRLTRLASKVAR